MEDQNNPQIEQIELEQIDSSRNDSITVPQMNPEIRKTRISVAIKEQYSSNHLKENTDFFGKGDQWKNTEFFLSDYQVGDQSELEYLANWYWGTFFEFFMYHVVFFMVLGPLINLVFISNKKKLALMKNLGFYGINATFFTQISIFISFVIPFYSFFFTDYGKSADMMEILVPVYYLLIRSSVIASKYASLMPGHLEEYYKSGEIKEFLQRDLLVNWLSQADDLFFRELTFALKRDNIDKSLFFIDFYYPLDQETNNSLQEALQDLRKPFEQLSSDLKEEEQFPPEVKIKYFKKRQMYYGFQIMYALNKVFLSGEINSIYLILFSVFIAIIRCSFGFIGRYMNSTPLLGNDSFEGFVFVCNIYNLLLIGSINYYLLFYGLQDIKRKQYYMIQASYMMMVWKNQINYKLDKVLPTINLVCSYTVKAWGLLRRIMLDYGQGYYNRYQMMLISFGIYNLISIVFMLLNLFKIFSITSAAQLFNFYDVSLTVITLLTIMYFMTNINDHFRVHERILQYNQNKISNFSQLGKHYFNNEYQPQSKIDEDMCRQIDQLCKEQGLDRKKYVKQLQNAYGDVIQMIKYDKNQRPFQLFGITITKELIVSIGVGVGSAVPAAIYSSIQGAIDQQQ